MDNHTPFLVENGGETHAQIQLFIDDYKAKSAARLAVSKKYGAAGIYADRRAIAGLHFDPVPAKAPDGFRRDLRDPPGVFRPDRRTPHGRAIADEFEIPLPGLFELSKRLGFNFIVTGRVVNLLNVHVFGDATVLLVPNQQNDEPVWTPPADCHRMKRSEFYAMKEEHMAKALDVKKEAA